MQINLLWQIFFVTFVSADLLQDISSLNTLYSTEGPTVDVLAQYELVLSAIKRQPSTSPEISAALPQIHLKKALIELNLNKESQAIEDLKVVLGLEPNNRVAKSRLIDVLVGKGSFTQLEPFLNPDEDAELLGQIQLWTFSFDNAQRFFDEKEWERSIEELDQHVLSLTPNNYPALELHYKAHLELLRKGNAYLKVGHNDLPVNMVIIGDLSKLLTAQPMGEISYYHTLASMIFYTEGRFESAKNSVKLCLKINNEYKPCGDLSKFLTKVLEFAVALQDIGQYYNMLESAIEEDAGEPNINFGWVEDFLFNQEIKASKLEIRKLKNISNNYEYLTSKAEQFEPSLQGSVKFIKDLNKLACESLVRGKKSASSFCAKTDDSFFPKHVAKIDKLLKKQKFGEAKTLMGQFTVNVGKTQLFRERYVQIEQYERQQQQQQQQQQRQRQQQQQQQHHQQQQQQNAPTKDYYKILDISRDADDRTVKKAHRTQTLKYHPDKYKGDDLTPDEAENKMQDINQAYEVLSNKELRERFDRGDDPNDPSGGRPQQQQHQQAHFDFGGFNFAKQFGGNSFRFEFN